MAQHDLHRRLLNRLPSTVRVGAILDVLKCTVRGSGAGASWVGDLCSHPTQASTSLTCAADPSSSKYTLPPAWRLPPAKSLRYLLKRTTSKGLKQCPIVPGHRAHERSKSGTSRKNRELQPRGETDKLVNGTQTCPLPPRQLARAQEWRNDGHHTSGQPMARNSARLRRGLPGAVADVSTPNSLAPRLGWSCVARPYRAEWKPDGRGGSFGFYIGWGCRDFFHRRAGKGEHVAKLSDSCQGRSLITVVECSDFF